MLGRLFWKFFFFIFMAQATAIVGVSVAIWLHDMESQRQTEEIDSRPPVSFNVEAARETLRYGGTAALRSLLETAQHPQIYAVDEAGHELLGRRASPTMLEQATRALVQQDGPWEQAVRRISASDGHTYLLFALADDGHGEGGPPPHLLPGMLFDGPPGEHDPHDRGMMIPYAPISISVLVSLVFAALLAWHFSKPIRSLRSAFGAVAEGKLDVRLVAEMGTRHDELADLARTFDYMTSRLQTLMKGHERLLHDVSHELRSPLARLQVAIELTQHRPDKIAFFLERIERECVLIDKLIGELLTLSQLDTGVMRPADEKVDIDELLSEIVDDARFEAEAMRRSVELSGNCQAVVCGSSEMLHRAVENVLRNAIRHTAEGSSVEVLAEVTSHGQTLHIAIRDHGPGVPESELEKIFTPFFRGGHRRSSGDGHGLGLAIARRAIEMHGGTIRASNLTGGGLSVDIVLPLEDSGKMN